MLYSDITGLIKVKTTKGLWESLTGYCGVVNVPGVFLYASLLSSNQYAHH